MCGFPIRKSTEASDVGIILVGLPLTSSSCSPSELKREGESLDEDKVCRAAPNSVGLSDSDVSVITGSSGSSDSSTM